MTDEPELPQRVALIDDEGVERWFLLHDAFDVDGRPYYLVEAADDPDQVLLLRESDGTLETVGEEEFDRVLAQLEAEE